LQPSCTSARSYKSAIINNFITFSFAYGLLLDELDARFEDKFYLVLVTNFRRYSTFLSKIGQRRRFIKMAL